MNNLVICKDVFGNEYPVDVERLQQRVGVYAIIIEEEKILLTRQWNGYSLVGGGVDKTETLEEAFVREVREETGLTAIPGSLIFQATRFFMKDEHDIPKQSFQFYFTHASIEGEISEGAITESEARYTNGAAEWVPLEEAEKLELRHSVDMKTILKAYDNSLRNISS